MKNILSIVSVVVLTACGNAKSQSGSTSAATTASAGVATSQFEQLVSIKIKGEDIDQFRSALANYASFSRNEPAISATTFINRSTTLRCLQSTKPGNQTRLTRPI
jgi:hypothetical protein